MRRTWDDAARSGHGFVVGTSEPVDVQVDEIFGLLEVRAGARTCLEIGCGDGRMTAELARRCASVVAVDVSSLMLERARSRRLPNVTFRLVSGLELDGVPDSCAELIVCYGVLQHLPRRSLVSTYIAEIARTLAPEGEAVVHLPVLERGARPRAWRSARSLAIAVNFRLQDGFELAPAYRGVRVTEGELARALNRASLRVAAEAEVPSHFPYARSVLLRLEHEPIE